MRYLSCKLYKNWAPFGPCISNVGFLNYCMCGILPSILQNCWQKLLLTNNDHWCLPRLEVILRRRMIKPWLNGHLLRVHRLNTMCDVNRQDLDSMSRICQLLFLLIHLKGLVSSYLAWLCPLGSVNTASI